MTVITLRACPWYRYHVSIVQVYFPAWQWHPYVSTSLNICLSGLSMYLLIYEFSNQPFPA